MKTTATQSPSRLRKPLRLALLAAGSVVLAGLVIQGCTAVHWNTFNFTHRDLSPELGFPGASPGEDGRGDGPRASRASAGCLSCHDGIESPSMHPGSVAIGCAECHGGDPSVKGPGGSAKRPYSPSYKAAMDRAHVLPSFPHRWNGSGNPVDSYGLLNRERAEFVRFINPGDLRVANESCGGCHPKHVKTVPTCIMAHSSMVPGSGTYNNGVVPWKNYILGEFYMPDGRAARAEMGRPLTEKEKAQGALPFLEPYPRFNISQPGNQFRALERGIAATRGLGTEAKVDGAIITVHKTRLNDPNLWMMGTNDLAGEYRSSGCTACHTVYANSSSATSGEDAKFGSDGRSHSKDPTIPKNESGHPITHTFTSAMPSSQCLTCHVHQGSGAILAYTGFMWWDGETDGKHHYHPDGRLKLGEDMRDLHKIANKTAKSTVFREEHRGPWSFRNVYKRDFEGRPIDKDGNIISFDDPDWAAKAVHLVDSHFTAGMHCIDCHTTQDVHGDGLLYGEMVNPVEIACIDCHGTVQDKATLVPSNKSSSGMDMKQWTVNADAETWFYEEDGVIMQRSKIDPELEWVVPQLMDIVDPSNSAYNEKAAVAKTLQKDTHVYGDASVSSERLCHSNDKMTCYSCHSSWTTSCSGCHLSARTNSRDKNIHYWDEHTNTYVGYYSQGLRTDSFILGINGTVKDNKISPVRSASSVCATVENGNRATVVNQQPTISSAGFSGTAFTPFPPHTVSVKDGQKCTACHISEQEDNNAKLAVAFNVGAHSTDFVGCYVYLGLGRGGVAAVRVGEGWEPQPVIGSDFHKLCMPASHAAHERRSQLLNEGHGHSSANAQNVALRGEYLLTADGPGGLRVFDVANVANKDVAQRIITAPFSPLGHDGHVATSNATTVLMASTVPMDPLREVPPENQEQKVHPLFGYAFVLDSNEGLVVVDINTYADGNPDNNFLDRDATFNPGNKLTGATSGTIIGHYLYALTPKGLVVVDIDKPTAPKLVTVLSEGLNAPRQMEVQFRFAGLLDRDGFKVLDVTDPGNPQVVEGSTIELRDARGLRICRSYAYVAAGSEGLAIIDVKQFPRPVLKEKFTAGGQLNDCYDLITGLVNASQFAYVADGKNGLRVLELWTPSRYPGCNGFSPPPDPKLIASYRTASPAISIASGSHRDRGVDESGNQMGVFGRLGSRPINLEERKAFYQTSSGEVFRVNSEGTGYKQVER